MLDYYFRSRKIKMKELKELLAADRTKQLMSEEVRTSVSQEMGDRLRPKDAVRS